MSENTKKEQERIRLICDLLYQATQPIQILSHIGWSNEVREKFFANDAKELPNVSYPKFDDSKPIELIQEAKKHISSNSNVDGWLGRQCHVLEKTAQLLSSCGTKDFFHLSSELYGTPRAVLPDQTSTSYGLAKQFEKLIQSYSGIDLGAPPPACHLPKSVAHELEIAAKAMFRDEAPQILIVDELSANALASPTRIRIRKTASFTDKDVSQLIHHEAYIHVATSLNGLAQTDLKILAASHPGTTKTQEGLAVFAEFISGSMDLDRMRRLADRVLAIQMAIEGADFLEIYQYFLERTGSRNQAFENARRVFRGGDVRGGVPFTKDIVYLDGLLRVHNFFRVIASTGRADCLRLLFCGKMDLEDIPVIYELKERGLCQSPKYLPPWAKDLRFLLCHLAYSSFLDSVDLSRIKLHYDALLSSIPSNH